jgi:hypothetical protein
MGQGVAPGGGGEFRRRGRGPGLPAAANSSGTLADAADSGEEFHRPSGVSCRRTKGRWGGGHGLLIGMGAGKKRQGI